MKKGLKIALLSAMLAFGGACVVLPQASMYAQNNIVMVRAEGETSEPTETIEVKETIEHWKDTYLVPLLSSVSITSVASAVFTIVLTIIREKRFGARDKDLKERSAQAEALIAEANAKIAEANAIIIMVKETFEAIKEIVVENEEVRKLLEDKFNGFQEMLAKHNVDIEKINKIEPILKVLVRIEAKVAMLSKDAVASGVAEDVNELVQLAKNL